MIKLTINPENSPTEKAFSEEEVKIGSGIDQHADLVLSQENIQPNHLKILRKDHQYLLFNLANDPFVTLNGLPFGKRFLKNFDLIQVGKTLIRFEIIESPLQLKDLEKSVSVQEIIKTNEHFDGPTPACSAPPNPEKWINKIDEQLEKLTECKDKNPVEKLDIDRLFLEVERLDQPQVSRLNEPAALPALSEATPKKNYTLSEFDDECENWVQDKEGIDLPEYPPDEPVAKSYSWKLWFWLLVFCSSIAALFATYYYLTLYNQSYDEEIRAAEGVADISMALKYAQINHIKPTKQNWSDPDFIKNSLANVVTHDYPIFDNLDSQGHFIDTPYRLRIYTSSDFSQFVVIAQPAPSLLQKIIPKGSIVVDSKVMELRKVNDLKGLNRLLVNPGTLDGTQAKEVSLAIQRGELIPLALIARKKSDHEFSPPKALTLIRPGAENLIYNAPRYYQLGENVMRKALHLIETPGSSHEVSRLKQEMSIIGKMPHIIFYSSLGIQFANDAQKALASFAPNANFLTAYITFNSRGSMINSHLLVDEYLALSDTEKKKQKMISPVAFTKEAKKDALEIDADDPLFFKLSTLASKRQDLLQSSYNQIILELNTNFDTGEISSSSNIKSLLDEYLKMDYESVVEIGEAIEKLQEEYPSLSKQQFLNFLTKANVNKVAERYQQSQNEKFTQPPLKEFSLEAHANAINNASTLSNLQSEVMNALVNMGCDTMNCDQQAILLQNRLRSTVITKLNQLIFSNSQLHFSVDEQTALNTILDKIWMTENHERSFYLDEFERWKNNSDSKIDKN